MCYIERIHKAARHASRLQRELTEISLQRERYQRKGNQECVEWCDQELNFLEGRLRDVVGKNHIEVTFLGESYYEANV